MRRPLQVLQPIFAIIIEFSTTIALICNFIIIEQFVLQVTFSIQSEYNKSQHLIFVDKSFEDKQHIADDTIFIGLQFL